MEEGIYWVKNLGAVRIRLRGLEIGMNESKGEEQLRHPSHVKKVGQDSW